MFPEKSTNRQIRKTSLSLCLFVSLALFFTLLFSCGHQGGMPETGTTNTTGITGEAKILKAWHGDYPVVEIDRLPEEAQHPGIGYIADDKTFFDVWSAFKPGEETPDVDFKSNLAFFVRNVQYFNRISIGKVKLKEGIAEIIAMETLSARSIEDVVAMSMVVVVRGGITGIKARGGVIRISK